MALGQQGGGRGTVSELGGRAGGGGGGDGGVQAGTTAMETAAVAVAGATEEEAGAGGLAGGADDVGAHEGTEALGAVAAAKDISSSRELAALAHEVRPNAGHTGDSIRYQAPGSRAVHLASEAECNICEQCECECAAELHFDPSDEGWYCEECFVEEYGSAWRDFVGVLPAVAAGVQLGGRGRSGQGGGVAAGENGGGGGGGGEG